MERTGVHEGKTPFDAKKRTSIWLATGAVVLLILILALTINEARENEMVEQFGRRQAAIVRGAATYIEHYISSVEKNMVVASRFSSSEKSIVEETFHFIAGAGDVVQFVAALDLEGVLTEVYPASLSQAVEKNLSHFEGRGGDGEKPFVNRLESHGNIRVGSVVVSIPQASVGGEYTGRLLAGISLSPLIERYLHPSGETMTDGYMILDEQGVVFVHSDRQTIGVNIATLIQTHPKGAGPSDGKVIMNRAGYGEYFQVKEKENPKEVIVAFAPVRIGSDLWTAALSTPTAVVVSLMRSATLTMVLGAAGLIVVFLIAIISIAYAGTRQLRFREELQRLKEKEDWQEKLIRESKAIEGIIEGSPIPMFVINRDHKVVFWNRACAELTGFDSGEMIGTDRQCLPFYEKTRPVIADLIVDNDIAGLEKYYGEKRVQKSVSIEGAYEAQDFYENLGGKSRHLYFLAAPIYDEEGEITAAIETLQDVSREKEMADNLRNYAKTIESELDRNITLRKTMEGSPIPVFVIDNDHKVICWNRACAELTGFDSGVMIGTDKQYLPFYAKKRPVIADLIVEEDIEGLEKYYGKQRIRKSATVEGAYEARDFYEDLGGKSRHLYFLAAPIYDENGNIIAAIETLQDVSREKEMAESLKEYAENLKDELDTNITLRKTIEGIIEGSPIPMFVIDKDHKVILWNRACAELTGYNAETMIGTDKQYLPFYDEKRPVIADLIAENDVEGLNKFYEKQNVRKSRTVEGAHEAQDFYENLGEKSRYLYFLAAPIYDEKGEIIAVIETLQDVTREKEMELGLKEYAESLQNELMENVSLKKEIEDLYNYLRSIVDSIPDKLFDLSNDGIINYVSKGRVGVRELTFQEITGKHFTEFVDPENRDLAAARWKDVRKGVFTPYEMEATARDGSKRNLLITPCPVHGTDRFVFVQRDITELKQLEKKFYESQKLAAIGQLSAGIAHEVRNPLSSIKMSLQILQKRLQPSGNDLRRFEIAQREVEHLEKLVNDVLIYAKPSEPAKEPSDITKIILNALAMVEKSISDKHINVQTNFGGAIAPVSADSAMLEQVFINICHNAIDAMEDRGQLVISTRLAGRDNQSVAIEIEDNGSGIDEEDMPHIFNPFFTQKRYGTGLGMTQVKKLVDLHGGTIEIESRKGVGTKITVAIPVDI